MKAKLLIVIMILICSPVSDSGIRECYYSEEQLRSFQLLQDWENVYRAIVIVESKNNRFAVGSKGDAGLLQILPKNSGGYLDEANRLSGYDKYRNEDRFCPVLTREIWEVVMLHHNPQKCLKKAIKMHNPRGGQKYADKVIREYEKLTK